MFTSIAILEKKRNFVVTKLFLSLTCIDFGGPYVFVVTIEGTSTCQAENHGKILAWILSLCYIDQVSILTLVAPWSSISRIL